jgi:LmbE family N-acetylglucosaminyl deacetylase
MRILILAPHTDDGEFGCGASIARFVEEGHEVHYVAFSAAEKSVPGGMPQDILRQEVACATKVLGIPPQNLRVLNFEVRDFPAFRQEILDVMVRLNAELSPAMVFLPSRDDTHQDHQTISHEGFRAFKKTSIFGFDLPWNNLTFTSSSFIVVDERHVEQKVKALQCYQSQAMRPYATGEFVRNLANVRGTQIGVKYAEAFEAIRLVRRLGDTARFVEA